MKMLLSTTALALVLGIPTLALSQDTTAATDQSRMQQSASMSGFLATRGQSDVFASDLIGHDVYARRASDNGNTVDNTADMSASGMRDMPMMKDSDMKNMDNIGQINEIVLSNDGEIRALVIGVGGFLGMGERDVAVTMDQVTFASNADRNSEMYVIVNTGMDQLKNSPAYDRTSMKKDNAAGNAEPRTDMHAFLAPKIERVGYIQVKATDVTTENLMGKSVYDVNDEAVGTVSDMILDDSGAVTNVIIDFGGFLGISENHVSLDFDELTIMSTNGHADMRVYVDANKQQIQGRPQYHAKN